MAKKAIDLEDIGIIPFNRKTGEEIIQCSLKYVKEGPKVKDWLMMFHRGTEIMARDTELRGETLRVFLFAISYIDYENKVLLSQMDIVKALGMKQQHVSRAFKQLVEKGIFYEGKKQGTVKTYYLDTEFGWKGSVPSLKKRAVEETKQKVTV